MNYPIQRTTDIFSAVEERLKNSPDKDDMDGLTEAQRLQKMIDMMTPAQHRAMTRQKQMKPGQKTGGSKVMLENFQIS